MIGPCLTPRIAAGKLIAAPYDRSLQAAVALHEEDTTLSLVIRVCRRPARFPRSVCFPFDRFQAYHDDLELDDHDFLGEWSATKKQRKFVKFDDKVFGDIPASLPK